ncbi:MAG: hypothetical protein HY369_02075, partial [Candidatus Aenigmarchaeota archaeon]|nr:hypothetical protein [Candidatus Aenigmarchaeota archaeon]
PEEKMADEDVRRIAEAGRFCDLDPEDESKAIMDVLRRQRLYRDKDSGKAHRILMRAFGELGDADGDPHKIRHAAYIGWRAARAAIYAVLRRHCQRFRCPLPTGHLANFEATVLSRKRKQPLTMGYSRAKVALLHECFHDGRLDSLRPETVYGELLRVGDLIDQAAQDGVGTERLDPKNPVDRRYCPK